MSSPEHVLFRRRATLGWAIIVTAACGLYFTGISHEAIWYDESVSIAIAKLSISEIIRAMPIENHPPLHFLLLHVVQVAFGNSEWAMRLPSALGAVGMVGLGAGPVRRVVGERTAFVYAGVVLFMPAVLIYAHEARMYSLATLAVTAAVLYGFLAVAFGRMLDWFSFGMATLAAAYLHYYGLIAVTVAHLFVAGWVMLQKRQYLRRWLVTGGLVFIGYLPWVLVLMGQTARVNRSGFWVPPVSGLAILGTLIRPFAYRELGPMRPVVRPWMAAAFVLSMTLIVFGRVLARKRRAQTEQTFGTMLIAVYLGTLSVAIALSLVFVPILYSRYMVVCMGLFALLVSLGIGQLRGSWLAGALVALAFCDSLTMRDVYTHYFNLPFRRLRQEMSGEIKPGDLIVTSDCFTVGPTLHYFPQAVTYYASNSFEASRDRILEVMSRRLHYNNGIKQLLATRQSFWSITDSTGLSRDVEDILSDAPGWEPSGQTHTFTDLPPYSLVSFAVTKYTYTGRQGPQSGHGNIVVHITGLRPKGNLMVMLFDRTPAVDVLPVRSQIFSLSSNRLDTTVHGLTHGEYVLMLLHDENSNLELDWKDGAPSEGTWIANSEKVNPTLGAQGFVFDVLKFSFHEAERRFDATMQYPRLR